MQILLALVAIFVVWLVIGARTSARSVARGAERIRSQLVPTIDHPSWVQAVNSLFALYQSGALTREEYDEAKRHLLASLKAAA
jgi:hypothetical protein